MLIQRFIRASLTGEFRDTGQLQAHFESMDDPEERVVRLQALLREMAAINCRPDSKPVVLAILTEAMALLGEFDVHGIDALLPHMVVARMTYEEAKEFEDFEEVSQAFGYKTEAQWNFERRHAFQVLTCLALTLMVRDWKGQGWRPVPPDVAKPPADALEELTLSFSGEIRDGEIRQLIHWLPRLKMDGGIAERPQGGPDPSKKFIRDYAIHWYVHERMKMGKRPTRNRRQSRPYSACDEVADALGLTYDAIEAIYNKINKIEQFIGNIDRPN